MKPPQACVESVARRSLKSTLIFRCGKLGCRSNHATSLSAMSASGPAVTVMTIVTQFLFGPGLKVASTRKPPTPAFPPNWPLFGSLLDGLLVVVVALGLVAKVGGCGAVVLNPKVPLGAVIRL